MSDHRKKHPREGEDSERAGTPPFPDGPTANDPLWLIDQCLATPPDDDPRNKILHTLRHLILQEAVARQQRETELKKLTEVIEKVTAPANRIGTLLDLPDKGLARIVVGGAEYYTNVDPRLTDTDLRIGAQVLVNEAYALIRSLGIDRNGPVVKIAECLPDGRLLVRQEPGNQTMLLLRSTDLAAMELKAGDDVRIDPSHRIAVERMEDRKARTHVLDETPTVTWDQIGGQQEAIGAIRKAIEYPLLHAKTFEQYKFTQPKGFLLHGPPGCGKTLIGQATAASLAKMLGQKTGAFLHIKGPEVLNMWLGESERIVRDLFAQARARRQDGSLPVLFIDEAESILGTRRAMRSFNITNTLVPMFCAEMDGIESLRDVVIILASNRPDLIDPAVLRPGRIDRKIKVDRPGRSEAADILKIYLTPDLPLDSVLVASQQGDQGAACDALVATTTEAIFSRSEETRILSVRLRSGLRETLYRGDLVSGAILASIVQRAKERAIERSIGGSGESGLSTEDLMLSVKAEYREGEILPPDDAAEEWLKLLDHHPQQVVGVSSFRKGRGGEERLVTAVI
jgi:proteasome-associated ATPase